MAKESIDPFPFLKQRKADISPGHTPRGTLAILADDGSWPFAKTPHRLQREIREDI